MPASAWIYPEPLGVVLIIAPWNYPFSLTILPLIGAIAAGNCAILKPSELAPYTSRLLAELIGKTFAPNYIAVVEGGVETSNSLLKVLPGENFLMPVKAALCQTTFSSSVGLNKT